MTSKHRLGRMRRRFLGAKTLACAFAGAVGLAVMTFAQDPPGPAGPSLRTDAPNKGLVVYTDVLPEEVSPPMDPDRGVLVFDDDPDDAAPAPPAVAAPPPLPSPPTEPVGFVPPPPSVPPMIPPTEPPIQGVLVFSDLEEKAKTNLAVPDKAPPAPRSEPSPLPEPPSNVAIVPTIPPPERIGPDVEETPADRGPRTPEVAPLVPEGPALPPAPEMPQVRPAEPVAEPKSAPPPVLPTPIIVPETPTLPVVVPPPALPNPPPPAIVPAPIPERAPSPERTPALETAPPELPMPKPSASAVPRVAPRVLSALVQELKAHASETKMAAKVGHGAEDCSAEPTPLKLPEAPFAVGPVAVPVAKETDPYARFVKEIVDPKKTLDLVRNHPRLMVLTQAPKRIQIGNEDIAVCSHASATDLSVVGKQVGSTVLHLWFEDADRKEREIVLSYLVRVRPDPEEKQRLDSACNALQEELNQAYPESMVRLKRIGDRLVVTGRAWQAGHAQQILQLVRANASADADANGMVRTEGPPRVGESRLFGLANLHEMLRSNGPEVVDMVRVAAERQVLLRVAVAEVDRAAARGIGLKLDAVGSPVKGSAASMGFGSDDIPLAIEALRSVGYARTLASPHLVVASGQTASIHSGGRFPVPGGSGNDSGGPQGVQFVPYGVRVQLTPVVVDRDRIRLNMGAEVSSRDPRTGSSVGDAFVYGLGSRNVQTTVELREGQTFAVGGLNQTGYGTGGKDIVILVTPEFVPPPTAKTSVETSLSAPWLVDPAELVSTTGGASGPSQENRRFALGAVPGGRFGGDLANIIGPSGYGK